MKVKAIIFVMLFFAISMPIIAQENWGVLGHSVSEEGLIDAPSIWWKLEDGVLTIKGKGDMPKFQNPTAVTASVSVSVSNVSAPSVGVSPTISSLPIVPWHSKLSSITSVLIEDSITNIGDGVFYGCKNLTSITIPPSVTNIGAWAFGRCGNLTSITIPEKVFFIGISAFQSCKKLEVVEMKRPVPPIIGNTIFGLTPIKEAKLIVPAGTKATYATSNVWKDFGIIEESTVSASGEWLPEGQLNSHITWRIENDTLFINGKGVMPNIADGLYAFWYFYRDYFTSVVIGNGITKIGRNSFTLHKNIHSIIIAESVTSIESRAFLGCSGLTSITIPKSVTNIDDIAFAGCKNLRIVEIKSEIPPIRIASFIMISKKAKLIVPVGAKSAYEADKYWSQFGTIEER